MAADLKVLLVIGLLVSVSHSTLLSATPPMPITTGNSSSLYHHATTLLHHATPLPIHDTTPLQLEQHSPFSLQDAKLNSNLAPKTPGENSNLAPKTQQDNSKLAPKTKSLQENSKLAPKTQGESSILAPKTPVGASKLAPKTKSQQEDSKLAPKNPGETSKLAPKSQNQTENSNLAPKTQSLPDSKLAPKNQGRENSSVPVQDRNLVGVRKREKKTEDEALYEELPLPLAQTGSNEGYVRYDSTYMLNDDKGVACVMAFFKAKMTIFYPDVNNKIKSVMVYQPDDDNVKISGSCDRIGQESQIDCAWTNYILSLKFGQDDINNSWFVSQFALTYDTSDQKFENPQPGLGEVRVTSEEGRRYWQTTNYESFRCLLLHDIKMSDALNNTAILHFDEVRVQAFHNDNKFRKPKHCIHRVHRDEMVPVTVGSVLAGSSLLTIMLYGLFRYFKIKKIQYDTMQ